MTKRNFISIGLSGSKDEDILVSHVNEEKRDGYSSSRSVKWPFNEDGSSIFDAWYSNELDEPPVEIGKKLYIQLFSDEFRHSLNSIYTESLKYDEVLIKIKANANPLLNRIPFEILHNGRDFMFSSTRTIVRYVDDNAGIYPVNDPLRKVLFVLAEPVGNGYAEWGHDKFVSEIEDKLNKDKINYDIIKYATIVALREKMEEARIAAEPYSSIFVIAHGESAEGYSDGCLMLHTDTHEPDPLSSEDFNIILRGNVGYFIFLCSCSSGSVTTKNPYSSVGHQLIYNGQAGAVLSMQRPVTVDFGLTMLKSLLNSLIKDKNIFQAYKESLLLLSKIEKGIPCLYTRPMKTTKQDDPLAEHGYHSENNRILSVLSIDLNKGRIALIFPGFTMGLKAEDYEKAKEESWINIPEGLYKYKRPTTAITDIGASKGIIAMLGKVLKPEDVDKRIVFETDNNSETLLADPEFTHYFFFGSRSHSYSWKALLEYSKDFVFDFSTDVWSITDKREDKVYEVPSPSNDKNASYDGEDYAIIEKMIDIKTGKVIFIIAGMWDTSTLAAGNYLLENIDRLYQRYRSGGFQLLLSIDAGNKEVKKVLIERTPLKKNT